MVAPILMDKFGRIEYAWEREKLASMSSHSSQLKKRLG
jgi:hypothetical protein